jgi:hypothetical protein
MIKWRLDAGQIEVVDDAVAQALRQKTPGERMLMVSEGWRFAKLWIEGNIRTQHPSWGDDEVNAEVRRRLSGGTG